MDFGQGKARTVASTVSATISAAGRPGWSMTATRMSPFLSGRVTSWSRVRPVARRKPSIGLGGGVGAGALALLAGVGGAVGEAGEREGQAAGRGEGGGVGVGEAALDEAVGDEAAQVLGRLPLHAGGDFLGEEFEQEVGHRGASGGGTGKPEAVREVKGGMLSGLNGAGRSPASRPGACPGSDRPAPPGRSLRALPAGRPLPLSREAGRRRC